MSRYIKIRQLQRGVSMNIDIRRNQPVIIKELETVKAFRREVFNLKTIHRLRRTDSTNDDSFNELQFQDILTTIPDENKIVLKYANGHDLIHCIREMDNISLKSNQIMTLIGQGLTWFKKHRLVHLDMKPENIIYDPFNGITFIDYYSLRRNCPVNSLESPSVTYGTLPYMSPEMFFENKYHQNTDLWSMGIIGFMLKEKYHPYSSDHISHGNLKGYVCTQLMKSNCDPEYVKNVCNLLHTDPDRRINNFIK